MRALQKDHDAPAVEVVELLPLPLDEAPNLGDALLRKLLQRILQLAPDRLERVGPVLPEQLPLEEPVFMLWVLRFEWGGGGVGVAGEGFGLEKHRVPINFVYETSSGSSPSGSDGAMACLFDWLIGRDLMSWWRAFEFGSIDRRTVRTSATSHIKCVCVHSSLKLARG